MMTVRPVPFLLFILLSICLIPCSWGAQFSGTGDRGSFRGTLDYRCGDDGQRAVLTFELTNTTSPGCDAVITGWYLNNPSGKISSVVMSDSTFVLLGEPVFRNGIDASPAGYYDIGASLQSDFGGDGLPGIAASPAGIVDGQSRIFQLVLRGTDLKELDTESFIEEAPEGGDHFLAVRFEDLSDGGGETVPADQISEPESVVSPVADVSVPRSYALLPNYPNPFNASTNIGFKLPNAGHVSLIIYDVLGRTARHLVDAHQEAGSYTAHWNGRDDQGHMLKSGVYFCIFEAGSCRETIKMVLSR
jgi:hypothetical protein